MSDQAELLRAIPKQWAQPPAEMVGKLPKAGTSLDYLSHALVVLILTDIDPLWTLTYVEDEQGLPIVTFQGSDAVLWGTLTVHGKSFKGVGVCTAKAFDLHKQLISDLLKNTAMRFGIGTMLWSKEEYVAPAPPPEPAITPMQKGEITAAIASLDAAAKDELQGWWKDNNLPSLKSGGLTERQAAVILERLNDLTTGGGVGSQPEAASGADREEHGGTPAADLSIDEGGPDPGQGNPSAAARAALERTTKR